MGPARRDGVLRLTDAGAGRQVRSTAGNRRRLSTALAVATRCSQQHTDRCRCLYRTRQQSACRSKIL